MDERLGGSACRCSRCWSGVPCLGGGPEPLRRRYPQAACQLAEPLAPRDRGQPGSSKSPWWKRLRPGRPRLPCAGQTSFLRAISTSSLPTHGLHACADPQAELAQWAQLLKKDGYVMWSGLGPDTLRALEGLFRDAGWGRARRRKSTCTTWVTWLCTRG